MIPIKAPPRSGTKEIEITVVFKVQERSKGTRNGRWEYGTAAALKDDLVAYVTSREGPLRDDYGPEAWGGYDGAFVTGAKVVRSEVRDA